MSSIKVIDINEEAKQEEPTEQIEEVKEEVNEVVEEAPANEQETKTEEVKEQPKQETKPVKAQDKLVRCPKCSREMKLKSYRYGHQQKCNGGIENTPVKPFSKPRAKPKAQPIVKEVYEEEVEVEEIQQREALPVGNPKPKPKLTQEVKNQILKPNNPLSDASADASRGSTSDPKGQMFRDLTNHFQLLQNQFIQQKKEKYNNLCQNMFSSKSKKKIRILI